MFIETWPSATASWRGRLQPNGQENRKNMPRSYPTSAISWKFAAAQLPVITEYLVEA